MVSVTAQRGLANRPNSSGVPDRSEYTLCGNGRAPSISNGDALLTAVRKGQLHLVKYLLRIGANPSTAAADGMNALHIAVSQSQCDIAEVLLDAEALVEINAANEKGKTALLVAIENGAKDLVELLLNRGAGIEGDNTSETPLFTACRYKHVDLVKFLLERGAQVNGPLPQEGGKTLLHLVAAFGSVAVAEMLIEAGADVNACDEVADTKTPLYDAVLEGRIAMVKLLVRRGASIETYGETWYNALCTAAFNGQLEIVKVFIQALGNEAIERHYVLHYAASGGRVRVLEYLTSLAPNLETEDEDGLTPLGTAVCDFKPRALQCLLVHGADIHAKDHKNKDFSYLHIAAEVNNVKATEILIASGADVHARDDLGGTPLHVAAACGAIDVLKVLLEHDADPYAETHTGFTVVHAAASNSRLSALQYLEERGWTRDFEKEFRGEPQMTPLTLAAGSWEACEAGLVQYLVDFQNRQRVNTSDSDPQLHGPSITHTATRSEFQREYRSDALLSAAECGHLDVVKYLCDNGAEIDMLARLGTTALMAASMYGHVDVVHYLLTERSARIASRDYDGLTAFHIAVKHGHDDIVKLLIAHGALVDDRTQPVPANEAVPFPELVPIHFAAQSGHFNVLKTLIKHGADLEIENADGLRTIQLVRSTEKGEICGAVGYLLSLGTVDEYSYCE